MSISEPSLYREYQGLSSKLIITDNGVIIKELKKLLKPKIGEKTIPYKSIAEVHYRRPSFGRYGYLALRIVGSSNRTFLGDTDHSIMFKKKKLIAGFEEAKALIEQKIAESISGVSPASSNTQPVPNDTISSLERLASLKEKGILTEEEFQMQKQKILSGSEL